MSDQRINRSGTEGGDSPSRLRLALRNPWTQRLMVALALAGLGVGGYKVYERAATAARVAYVQRMEQATVRVECANPPAWMSPDLLNAVMKEVETFAAETVPARPARDGTPQAPIYNYHRLRDPLKDREVALDRPDVLRELAQHFTTHAAERNNAWVREVTAVQRDYIPQRNEQVIRLTIDFRQPLGFIAQGSKFYLVEAVTEHPDGTATAVRLPGEYSEADRKLMSALLMVRGVDEDPPPPGQPWRSRGAIEGLRLMALLADVPYRQQIDAINVTNIDWRRDKNAPQIILDTTFGTQVHWGLSAKFDSLPMTARTYEIQPAEKLRNLYMLFIKFNRIDGGHPYVDIRLEPGQVRVPKRTTPESTPAAPASPPARG